MPPAKAPIKEVKESPAEKARRERAELRAKRAAEYAEADRVYMEKYRAEQEEKKRLRDEADKEEPKTEVIYEFKNGCTVVALLNNAAYRKRGEGCMQTSGPGNAFSYDWQARQEAKEYRGVIICGKDGKRKATVVLEWEDYQDDPKPGQRKNGTYRYDGYGKRGRHGVKSPFCPFGDGEKYYFNHFGHFEHSTIQPLLAEWFMACGGKLAKDETPEFIGCTTAKVKQLQLKEADKKAFAKAHPGEDYAYRQNFGWESNGWEKPIYDRYGW